MEPSEGGNEIPSVQPRGRIVIGLDDLAAPPPATTHPPAPPEPQFPPVAGIAPAQSSPAVDSSHSGYTGQPRRPPSATAGDMLLLSVAVLWKLGTALLIALAIGGYVWGGSNDAHQRCLMHRLTDENSLIDNFACAVEH